MVIRLAYIGISFYIESGTTMSSLIPVGETDTNRWDWGKIETALADGHEVLIRPANTEEIEQAYKRLQEIKDDRT